MNNLKWRCFQHIQMHLEYLMLILTIFSSIGGGFGHENPKLTMDLLNSGFHRELKYGVIFPDLQGQQNTFLIKQRLPASVYVSTDQLNDLQRLDRIHYFVEGNHVDIEKPTEASLPFDILIYGNTAFLQTISLPIHFRYHAPANKSFITVSIKYPELFLQSTETIHTLDTTQQVIYTCKDSQHRCRWIPIEYDNYSRRTISANVPIGNASLSTTITYCTITLTYIASAFVIYVLLKKKPLLHIRLQPKMMKFK